MSQQDDMQAELDALQRELKQGAHPNEARSQGASAPASADFERILQEIQARLKDAAEDSEEVITEHPFAAVASAFLLGFVVGRLLGRT